MMWLLGCLAGVGCAPAPTLDGSLTAVVDLTYERATLEPGQETLALRFLKARGDKWDTPLKVAVSVGDLGELTAGTVFDLAEELPGGGQRGSVTRNVLDDKNTSFPLLLRGRLKLDDDPSTAALVHGDVSLSFVQGNEVASGKAVFGSFAAEVVMP